MTEWRDDPDFRAWAKDRKEKVLSQLDNSACAMSILSPPFNLERLDVQQALELGASLLLGKPIVLLVQPGTECPPGLARAADEIVEYDMPIDTPGNKERLTAALQRLGLQ